MIISMFVDDDVSIVGITRYTWQVDVNVLLVVAVAVNAITASS
jgi:hypothetical protein